MALCCQNVITIQPTIVEELQVVDFCITVLLALQFESRPRINDKQPSVVVDQDSNDRMNAQT